MFKAPTFMAMVLASTLSFSQAEAGLMDFLKPSIKVESQAVRDVYAGIKFHYLDKTDRVLIVTDFLKSVELEYAPLQLKEQRLGISFKQIKEEAIAAEEAVEDILIASKDRKNEEVRERISYLQAESNMDFLDRLQLLVAKFKDTHFGLYEKIPRPFMYNGIRLFRINGKIVVGSIEKKFLGMTAKLSGADFSSIQVGDEVVGIDGVDVEKKVAELRDYIAASSFEFADSQAVRALTLRNFKYEKKNYMTIHFKSGRSFKLPLMVNNTMNDTPRLDAITFFNKHNIQSDTTAIGITFDQATGSWKDSDMSFTGYNVRHLAQNLKGVVEYKDDGGSVGMRTGYFITKGKTYSVMQLMTFATRTLTSPKGRVNFLDAIRAFALDAKENELPVILDLRSNGGGNGAFPAALLSIFTPEGYGFPSSTRGVRLTPYVRNLNEPLFYQSMQGEEVTYGITYQELRDMLDDALAERKVYPPMYNMTGVITADPVVRGFDNKMAVLVTADCISACDMTAALFKFSGRAPLIGTHSNGTGAGYSSTSQLNTNWEDKLRTVATNIPNFLFGFPHENLEINVYEEGSVEKLCSENIPVPADVKYQTTETDLKNHNLGWLRAGAAIIDQIQ